MTCCSTVSGDSCRSSFSKRPFQETNTHTHTHTQTQICTLFNSATEVTKVQAVDKFEFVVVRISRFGIFISHFCRFCEPPSPHLEQCTAWKLDGDRKIRPFKRLWVNAFVANGSGTRALGHSDTRTLGHSGTRLQRLRDSLAGPEFSLQSFHLFTTS